LKVARALGGGGHAKAAGATFHGTLSEARERVWKLLEEASRDKKASLA
jgi:phosphoesterase RecJ-like protein